MPSPVFCKTDLKSALLSIFRETASPAAVDFHLPELFVKDTVNGVTFKEDSAAG